MRRISSWRPARGFTLIEVLITVVIVGILTAVALPAYTGSVQRTQRSLAKGVMMENAQTLERFYTTTATGVYTGGPLGSLVSPKGASAKDVKYNIVTVLGDNTFTITATPVNGQAGDKCGTMTLSNTGAQTAAKPDCW